MHKKDAFIVDPGRSNAMGKPLYTNSDSTVWYANARSSGQDAPPALPAANTGSGSGLLKVTLSGGYANFLATVFPHLKASKIIGLNKCRGNKLTIPGSSILSMMRPIFIRTGVF
jgi:hypothetical protein